MALRITEKQIEDFICEHPKYLGMRAVVDRQIRLPHGILDILAVCGYQVFVIELKAVELQEKDIGQILRYKFDVAEFLLHAGLYYYHEWIGPPPVSQTISDIMMRREWRVSIGFQEPNRNEDPRLVPYLIGKSVDDKVLAAATAAGIEVYNWEYFPADDSFAFYPQFFDQSWDERALYPKAPPFPDWLDRTLGHLIKPCCQEVSGRFLEMCGWLFNVDKVRCG